MKYFILQDYTKMNEEVTIAKEVIVVAKMPNPVPQIFQMCFRLCTKTLST